MSTIQTSFTIITDTEGYPLYFPFPTHTPNTQTSSHLVPTGQTSVSLQIASLTPRRLVSTWEPYVRPTDPMRRNRDIARSLKHSPDTLIPLYHPLFPSPPPPYSPSSLPSYSPAPTYSSPPSFSFPINPPPINYEAYTEEYGFTHLAYFLSSVVGTVAPDSSLWAAWANASHDKLEMLPGWSILMRDHYEVFTCYVFEDLE
jgi:hypothetical protein